MRAPPDPIRQALMACFLNTRAMEVTDDVFRLPRESIRHLEPQTEKHFHKALLWDIKRVHPQLLIHPSVAFHLITRNDREQPSCAANRTFQRKSGAS
jgi:hypothetical protein